MIIQKMVLQMYAIKFKEYLLIHSRMYKSIKSIKSITNVNTP